MAVDIGGERQRLSVMRRQCLMLLVMGLLPFFCSLFQGGVFSLFHRLIQQIAPHGPLGKVAGARYAVTQEVSVGANLKVAMAVNPQGRPPADDSTLTSCSTPLVLRFLI